MQKQDSESIKKFLTVGKLEGYSYLVLLFIAMPLKYLFDLPEAVKIVGMIHGVLFVAFMFRILLLMIEKEFNFKKAFYAFVLSLIPFGTFYLRKII